VLELSFLAWLYFLFGLIPLDPKFDFTSWAISDQKFVRVSSPAEATAVFLDFQMNSKTAIKQARPIPASNMTKTPPTLARLSSLAFALLSSSDAHWPPPLLSFHQRFLSTCSCPASCSFKIADEMGMR